MHVPSLDLLFRRPDGVQAKTVQAQARPLFSIPAPADADPSILLGNRYLSRGDGAVLSSSSGMGKSAMAIQLATLWGLGRPAFGIRPHSAFRILYIQSEDSDGDMAEVTASMIHGLNLTPEDLKILNTNILTITDRVNRGAKFLASLRQHIAAHKPDLVILNPLQAFIDGDITSAQDIGGFLREGLNALNEPATFAYLLIHHTTKPATGKDRSERLWHEVMYDMAGGAEIINWARAILSLRAAETEGEFNLVLAKRGKRAGVTKEVEQGAGVRQEPVTVLPLKHSTAKLPSGQPMVFWESRVPSAAPEKQKQNPGGRTATYAFADYVRVFPAKDTQGLPLNQLHKILDRQCPISKSTLYRAMKRWSADGDVEIVQVAGRDDNYRKAL